MGDPATLTTITGAGALTAFSAAVWVLLRLLRSTRKMVDESDERYRKERHDHEATAGKLDAEEDKRRQLKAQLDEVSRELRSLGKTVEQQTILIGQQTVQIGQQTARIGHLEAEVARLTGAAS